MPTLVGDAPLCTYALLGRRHWNTKRPYANPLDATQEDEAATGNSYVGGGGGAILMRTYADLWVATHDCAHTRSLGGDTGGVSAHRQLLRIRHRDCSTLLTFILCAHKQPLGCGAKDNAYTCRPLGGDARLCRYALLGRRHRKMKRTHATHLEATQEAEAHICNPLWGRRRKMMRTYATPWEAARRIMRTYAYLWWRRATVYTRAPWEATQEDEAHICTSGCPAGRYVRTLTRWLGPALSNLLDFVHMPPLGWRRTSVCICNSSGSDAK